MNDTTSNLDAETVFNNMDLDTLVIKNEDYVSNAIQRPSVKPLVVNRDVLDKLPRGPRRAMGGLGHMYDEARELIATTITDEEWLQHRRRANSQLDSLASFLTIQAKVQREYSEAGSGEDVSLRHRLNDEESKVDGKIRRVMDAVRADLERRRQIPTEAGPIERAGTEWIKKGVELYLADGHAACFMYSVMETDLPALRPSDKLGLNRMMLTTVIEEACNHINGTDEVC